MSNEIGGHRVRDDKGKLLPERKVTLEGCIFGIYDERADGAMAPALVTIDGQDYFAVFSSEQKMLDAYALAGVRDVLKIKKVTGPDFLESVPASFPIILDPYLTEHGTVRFSLIRAAG